jgi:histidinol-phosphate aminotransferase
MPLSRRTLLRRLGAGAAAAVAAPRASLEGRDAGRSAVPRHGEFERLSGPIRLDTNQSVYGPSPAALAAMRDTPQAAASRYPDVEAEALRRRIAAFHRVAAAQVVLGCGSSEILCAAIHAFAGAGSKVVVALPAFEAIGGWIERAGAQGVGVPVSRDFSHDLHGMLALIDEQTTLVYICNPHNPTGRVTRRADLDAFLRALPAGIVVLIDEAYHHYVGDAMEYASFIDRPFGAGDERAAHGRSVDDARVIVTRSFSKIYGLAGLRVGYAVASSQLARILASHQLVNAVGVVGVRAAIAALEDIGYVRTIVDRNTDDRQEFFNQAVARMLRPDSVTNFVMLETGRKAIEVVDHFREHGILVSPIHGMDQNIRVSLGRPAEMREFWRVWDLVVGHKMLM